MIRGQVKGRNGWEKTECIIIAHKFWALFPDSGGGRCADKQRPIPSILSRFPVSPWLLAILLILQHFRLIIFSFAEARVGYFFSEIQGILKKKSRIKKIRTGEFSDSFQRFTFHDHRIAGTLHIDRVKSDRGWFTKFQLPIGVRRLQTLFVHYSNELLRQTTVIPFYARYLYPGTGLIVRRAVLQRVRSTYEQNTIIFDILLPYSGWFQRRDKIVFLLSVVKPCIARYRVTWIVREMKKGWKEWCINRITVSYI